MDCGWAWWIDHERLVNRGYVYCSQAISDDAAAGEFLRKNPKIRNEPRLVKFTSGYLVMMVGNKVPYHKRHTPDPREREIWNRHKTGFIQQAARGITSEEALAYVKHPGWRWNADPQ